MGYKLTSRQIAEREVYRTRIVAKVNKWLGLERTFKDLAEFLGGERTDKNLCNRLSAIAYAENPNLGLMKILDEKLPL